MTNEKMWKSVLTLEVRRVTEDAENSLLVKGHDLDPDKIYVAG